MNEETRYLPTTPYCNATTEDEGTRVPLIGEEEDVQKLAYNMKGVQNQDSYWESDGYIKVGL